MASNKTIIQGRQSGRKPKLSSDQESALIKMYRESVVPVVKIAAAFEVSKPTVYNILRRHGLAPGVPPEAA